MHNVARVLLSRPVIAFFTASALLLLGLLIAGCESPSGTSSRPKPGTGIADYRELARDAHRSVAATVDALDALSRSDAGDTKAVHRFDRALHELELSSLKTRARAEAIITRGQAFFDEWKEQLALATNHANARAETERYARLYEDFDRIRERSGEVRAEFRPFMMKLREFRATFDKSLNSTSVTSTDTIGALTINGRRVLDTLGAVSKSLDDAEADLRATLAAKQ